MSGGGGGGWSGDDTGWVQSDDAVYEGESNEYLRDLLKDYNARDTEGIRRHLGTLEQAIAKDIDGCVETVFGGSAKKHTAVDGISDVDVLLVVNQSSLAEGTPREALEYVEQSIRNRLPKTDIRVGALAVKIKFSDGIEIQILPALRTATGIRIADGAYWSHVVRPHVFAKKLTEVNQACGGGVVKVIKLFKGLQYGLPKEQKISGYHVESLAIEAFRDYKGRHTLKDMLLHYVSTAKTRVLTPIAESTGQSVHVDDKLGEAHSAQRQMISFTLSRMSAKLEDADHRRDIDRLRGLFED